MSHDSQVIAFAAATLLSMGVALVVLASRPGRLAADQGTEGPLFDGAGSPYRIEAMTNAMAELVHSQRREHAIAHQGATTLPTWSELGAYERYACRALVVDLARAADLALIKIEEDGDAIH